MKLYDIDFKFDNNENKLLEGILESLDDLYISSFYTPDDNNLCFFDGIWDKTKDICEKYIKTDWFQNWGIETNEIFQDIKFHVIFNIYLFIYYRTRSEWKNYRGNCR